MMLGFRQPPGPVIGALRVSYLRAQAVHAPEPGDEMGPETSGRNAQRSIAQQPLAVGKNPLGQHRSRQEHGAQASQTDPGTLGRA
jgi:hypothetical protein